MSRDDLPSLAEGRFEGETIEARLTDAHLLDEFELLDQPPRPLAPAAPPAQASPLWMLALAPATLGLTIGAVYVALFYAEWLFFTVVSAVFAVPFLWLAISALRPALPDRACPRCQAAALVLIDPQQEVGVRCLACPHVDREKRIPYLKDVMNDPEIAALAGFVIDAYGEARLPGKAG